MTMATISPLAGTQDRPSAGQKKTVRRPSEESPVLVFPHPSGDLSRGELDVLRVLKEWRSTDFLKECQAVPEVLGMRDPTLMTERDPRLLGEKVRGLILVDEGEGKLTLSSQVVGVLRLVGGKGLNVQLAVACRAAMLYLVVEKAAGVIAEAAAVGSDLRRSGIRR